MSKKHNRGSCLKVMNHDMCRHVENCSKTRKKHTQMFASNSSVVEIIDEKLDKKQIEENLKNFKTADGKHFTGLLDSDRPIVDLFMPDIPLEKHPSSKKLPLLKASADGRTYPDEVDYSPACGNITSQSIGSCYMHANVNFAKWWVWLRTGVKYSPSNSTIDTVYAKNVSGGWASDIKRLWDVAAGDDFIDSFKAEAAICGFTKENCGNYTQYKGTGDEGKQNAIKLFCNYGPLWYAHDCGLYSSSGYHAILMIGYDKKNIYFQNSWGGQSLPNVTVTWNKFTTYNHQFNTFFAAFGQIPGVNLFKNL